MNLKFSYLYRDAGNYKNFGHVIFSNPNALPLEVLEDVIRASLIDGEFFSADHWELPSLFFEIANNDDHEWHEFDSIQFTDENTSTPPIEDLMIRIKNSGQTIPNASRS